MTLAAGEEAFGGWRGWPIEARGLTKRYRGVPVVDGVALAVGPGEIYGFLGPNGAGKTTTMRMLLGLIRRDAGEIRLFGRDPAVDALAALEDVSGIIEEPRLYPYLSGRANLELLSDLDMGRSSRVRVEEVLETVELRERAKDRVGEYSQGMRQRLGIAACLVRNPKLMLLDEPANGVDPAGMRFLRRLLRRLGEEGITVFLSSHLLAEVQEICTRLAIIAAGRIAYEGRLDELLERAGRRYRLQTSDLPRTAEICQEIDGLSGIDIDADRIGFAIDSEAALLSLAGALTEAEIPIQLLTPEQVTLERVFFELTETPLRAEEPEPHVSWDCDRRRRTYRLSVAGDRPGLPARPAGGQFWAHWRGVCVGRLQAHRRRGPGDHRVAGGGRHRRRRGTGGTLKTILIRSVRRRQLLAAKTLALFTYLATAMAVFFVVATVAGVIAWGFHPVIDISGHRLSALHALLLGAASVAVYLLPVFALASFGLFLSVATRQSVAAIGGTLLYAMSLQGLAAISGIKAAHPYLLTNQLTAWHGLFQSPVAGGAILRSLWVSAAFALPPLIAAWVIFTRRDVTT